MDDIKTAITEIYLPDECSSHRHFSDEKKGHSKFSPSGSSQWLNCPGSVDAQLGYPNETSDAAEEGTLAHSLAELCLKSNSQASYFIDKYINGKIIDESMAGYVQEYLDYINSFRVPTSTLLVEYKVPLSYYSNDDSGTLDCSVIDNDNKICHIFDLKYGRGVKVDSFENTQAQLYALCMLIGYPDLYSIESFTLHIVQPRMHNTSSWSITTSDLLKFQTRVLESVSACTSANPIRMAGEAQCKWCKAKGDCDAHAKYIENKLGVKLDKFNSFTIDAGQLSDERRVEILENKSLILAFIKSIEDFITKKIKDGGTFPTLKLVRGKTNRKFGDNAEDILVKHLGDDARKTSLIGIPDAEKALCTKLGKKKADDVISDISFFPKGKITLAPISDRRPDINTENEDEDMTAVFKVLTDQTKGECL
jgi:hypothetical protein